MCQSYSNSGALAVRTGTYVRRPKDIVSVESFRTGFKVDIANRNAIFFAFATAVPALILVRVQHGMLGDLSAMKERIAAEQQAQSHSAVSGNSRYLSGFGLSSVEKCVTKPHFWQPYAWVLPGSSG